jgi:hypothetical protein
MKNFMLAWLLFSLTMGICLIPFIEDFYQRLGGGLILGFFAGVLSQIEGNTRK